jgi:Ni/Co efflux regulator RcnB
MTKIEQVLQHLKEGNSITQREAAEKYNSWRLGDVIFKLRRRGYEIEDLNAGKENYSRYKLVTKDQGRLA